MASKQDLSDEYVAEALKQDARDSSIKYSTLGLEALLPKRCVVLWRKTTSLLSLSKANYSCP